MLTELSIRNFAIIDDISITFYEGLTIMTGEAGAGKSIVIDAVQLLAGARASVEFVRHQAQKAEITGLFFIDEQKSQVSKLAQKHDIDIGDHMVVIERSITNKGKSICKINGKIVTLTVLRAFGSLLVAIHSQHDTLHLMDAGTHLRLLDQFSANEIQEVKEAYQKEYNHLKRLRQQYASLAENEQQVAQRMDLLSFQLKELQEAELTKEEDETLEEERNHLHHFEKIAHAVQESYYTLHGEGNVLEKLTTVKDRLTEVGNMDEHIHTQATEVTNLFYQLEEISFELRNYQDSMHFDEDRLNQIEQRLFELNRLKKKYGATVTDMLQYQEEVANELAQLENKDEHLEQLSVQMNKQESLAKAKAKKLHSLRKKAAESLINAITTELQDLFLPNARFSVQITKEETLGENGFDQIEFMLSTNIGEPVKPLSKIASGGELSRIMLAINKIFAAHDEVGTVIFDEIDTGVSGRVAQAIAEKMYQMANTTQVLGITHLSQVAAMADNHLVIQKGEEKGRTVTFIHQLEASEKTHELAKMITGNELSSTALEHANQLLSSTAQYKKNSSSSSLI